MWRLTRILATTVSICLIALLIACGSSGSTPPSTPSFNLSVSPQSLSIPIGEGGGTVQVSLQGVNGFNDTVSVAISGLPTGVTTSPASPFMMTPGDIQTVSFNAEAGIKPSVANISFNGTSGTLASSAALSLSVGAPVYAYVESTVGSGGGGQISGYAVNDNTGAVTTVPGSPFSLPNGCCTLGPIDMAAVSGSGGAYLYALGEVTGAGFIDTIYTFPVNGTSGALNTSSVLTTTFAPSATSGTLAVQPNGQLLYLVQSNCTYAFSINPANGGLTQTSCSNVPAADQGSFVIAPSGNFAFAAVIRGAPAGSIYTFSVNPSNGLLTQMQTISTGNLLPGKLFIDPQGRALYLLSNQQPVGCGGLAIWSIDPTSGALTPLSTSFPQPGCAPASMAFTANDLFTYISSPGAQTGIYGGALDANGNLTSISGSPFGVSVNPQLGVVEPSLGNYLIEAVGTPQQVTSFAIDPTTGSLTQASNAGQSLSGTPVRIVAVQAP